VLVAMMQIGVVNVFVQERFVTMPVCMRLAHSPVMQVKMMLVMDVAVLVFDRIVLVLMVMAFGQMYPDAKAHQKTGDHQL
jgi:hypothetical protein